MSHPLYFAEDGDEIGESFTDGIPPHIVGNLFVVLMMIEIFQLMWRANLLSEILIELMVVGRPLTLDGIEL